MHEPPPTFRRQAVAAGLLVVAVALGAQLSVPVPLSPVPVSLQTLFVALAALILRAPWAAAAMGLYLGLGALGLPVFADGKAGVSALAGPTGGFLVGFAVTAPLGALAVQASERRRPRWLFDLGVGGLVHAGILAIGVAWLAASTDRSLAEAARSGAWPFVPGGLLKTALAGALAPGARRALAWDPPRTHGP